ncbi:PepSY domain-containing protein [Corynebacterium sanguinis]|uniref:PepSY domain-containing protein n=1 Tax=Corynebacterium sanguinis TaxID=2594913 RepID=UPI0021BD06EE|nr:PepSY domain-containing protein [Corynebacterium sanguinis]
MSTIVQSSSTASGLPALTRRIHFYAGLFIASFIFVAALSGGLYALAPTLENFFYKNVLTVPADDGEVAQVWPSSSPIEPTRVLLIDESIAENEELRSVLVNPHGGQVIGDAPSYSGLGELPLRHWILGAAQKPPHR